MAQRNRHIHLVTSVEEKQMLAELAARRGLSASDILRLLLRDEYARVATAPAAAAEASNG